MLSIYAYMGYVVNRLRELRRNATPEEKKMWTCLREYRKVGYVFRRQYFIGKHWTGTQLYYFVTDFACLKVKLIIEIDGPIHNNQKEYDVYRQQVIESSGFTVIRFTNDEVNNQIIQVCRKIELYLPDFKK